MYIWKGLTWWEENRTKRKVVLLQFFVNNKRNIRVKMVWMMAMGKLKRVQVYTGQDNILIVSSSHTRKLSWWNEKKIFAQFKGKLLIGGYFNWHHMWSNSKDCTTDNILCHCITELETKIASLNDSSQTYISDATGSKTALALTFVDPRWELLYVERGPWNSDHYPISIEYNGITEPRNGSKRFRDCIIKASIGLHSWIKLRKIKNEYWME